MSKKNDKIDIKVFATRKEYADYDTRDEAKIVDVVRKEVLPREKAEYHSVKVKVKRRKNGSPKHIVAYMLRKDTYTADVVRADVDENYQVQSFVDDYANTDDDEEEENEEGDEGETYESFDFIAATPVPEIPTAKAAVEKIHQMAINAGLKSKILLGADASVANYKTYLKSGLRGFVNITPVGSKDSPVNRWHQLSCTLTRARCSTTHFSLL
jgi:hypothetical protein